MPTITLSVRPLSKSLTASVRMPQTFLPQTSTSFTHLTFVSSPVSASIASQTAAAAATVMIGSCALSVSGRSRRLM